MKSKSIVLALSLLGSSVAMAKSETYKVDTAKSVVRWTGSKVVGNSHTGTVNIKEGTVTLDDAKPGAGEIVVDVTSIVDEDLKDKSFNQKLVGHLKSPDFFDVEKHPTAKLVIDKIDPAKDGKHKVSGKLTIKGHTKPVELVATQKDEAGGKTVDADLVFDRTDFDVRYGSGKFFQNLGDKMIADDIKLQVKLKLVPAGETKTAKQ